MRARYALGASLAIVLACGTALAELPADEPGSVPPPPLEPHWVFLTDAAFMHLTEGKIVIVDADQAKLLGMFSTGYLANGLLSGDGKNYYIAETFYSRGTRGDRTDVITIYDMATFAPVGEVVIPGRFLAVTQLFNMRPSPDGRFLYVFNLTPATSVIVVDIEARKVVGEISTPGCALVHPGEGRFIMPCGDGTFLQVNLDAEGRETSRTRTPQPIFNPDVDPVSERPAITAKGYAFVSYGGKVYEVDMSGDAPVYAEPWPLVDEEQALAGWLPGGWKHLAYNPHTDELFVGMHQGGPGTHEQPGSEIWVFNLAEKKRVRVITPEEPVISIAVSSDADPVLTAITESLALAIMDPQSGEQKASMSGLMELGLVVEMP